MSELEERLDGIEQVRSWTTPDGRHQDGRSQDYSWMYFKLREAVDLAKPYLETHAQAIGATWICRHCEAWRFEKEGADSIAHLPDCLAQKFLEG